MGNSGSLPRDTIPSQIGNLSESGGMAEYGDFKRPIIQTWILKIYCSCEGCQDKVKKVLRDIDAVHTVTIDPADQKVTVTGTLISADVLLKKLLKKCGKHAELCPVTQKNDGKTQSQHREQNSSKDVVGGKKEQTAMAEREMQRNEARTQNQHTEQNSGKDVGGDKKEHTALALRETQRKKPRDPKRQTEQKPGNDGGGNANDNAAVAQSNMQNKTLKTQKEQNSGRHEDNGQVYKDADALFTLRPIVFKMKALEAATNNFHDDNKIGGGGFGHVYKGTTHDGKEIAVKKLLLTSGRKEFLNEKILAKFQHRNVVELLGCCVQGSERLLVYKYISNKSLDKFLSDPDKRKELDWDKRYIIILGIAHGLSYLHEGSQLRIVHRDIKASNILLDENLNPKITDFGTAKVLPEDGTDVSTGIVGTPGYMAPEYLTEGQLSVNTDVYSFGIVLLELLTGKKISSEPMELLGWVWRSYKRDKVVETIDSTIIETCDKEKASRCIKVGLLCTHADSLRRPPMSEVTAMLSTSVTLPVPTNPPTWILKIYCSCEGCQDKVKKVLRDIDAVHTVTIDPADQKVTVTGTLISADVLLKKLLKKCGKHAELCPVTQKNEGKTESQHREQNSSKDVVGGKKEHTTMAEREMQRNEARTQNQHREQNSGKDVGGDKKEHTALARRKTHRKKPRDPKRQTQQKPGNDGGGNANDNAAVAQSNMENKTLKTQKEQNSGRHEGKKSSFTHVKRSY